MLLEGTVFLAATCATQRPAALPLQCVAGSFFVTIKHASCTVPALDSTTSEDKLQAASGQGGSMARLLRKAHIRRVVRDSRNDISFAVFIGLILAAIWLVAVGLQETVTLIG